MPSGATFTNQGNGTATISGTAGSTGTFTITLTARNGVGSDATQAFTLTIFQPAAITSTNGATFTVGSAGTFSVAATGSPSSTLSETGALPSGVTFNSGSGVLSGTPAAGTAGSYSISFIAHNGFGTDATQSFTLTVNQAPAITSTNNAPFTAGTADSFTVTASGFPTPTLSVSGALPAGVTFNTANGVLSGTPTASGTFPISFTAHNGSALTLRRASCSP